jgi:hypothetical protein
MGLSGNERLDDSVVRVKSPDEGSHFVQEEHEIHLGDLSKRRLIDSMKQFTLYSILGCYASSRCPEIR